LTFPKNILKIILDKIFIDSIFSKGRERKVDKIILSIVYWLIGFVDSIMKGGILWYLY
jgi:hypothetical protein